MKLFDVIGLHEPLVTPEESKVHLAVFNGSDHPITVYREGNFEKWQAWQSQKNFSRNYIVSLIRMIGSQERWLFAGVYRPISVEPHRQRRPGKNDVWYTTTPVDSVAEISGRLIVQFKNQHRQNVPYGESVADALEVVEMRPKPLSNRTFTGYRDIRLSKAELDFIVREEVPEWVGPLSAVSGIYLITDCNTGRLYVGSASAQGKSGPSGIWARWKQYSANGHGGNTALSALLEDNPDYAKHFQYAVLEVLPPQSSDDAVKEREGHWKRVLGSYEHGYNQNLEKDISSE